MTPLPHRLAGTRFAEPQDERREFDATYRLEREVADARRRMGAKRWAELQREWER